MRITILAVGKIKEQAYSFLLDEYLKRIPWKIVIKEKNEEGELLDLIPKSTYKIALDERGKQLSSIDFAREIERRENITFFIGGADGLSEKTKKSSDLLLSFGAFTYPHKLVRVMLIEQIYRTHSILSNHPYHR